MASGPTFYPFPKTPHLSGSAVVDDDQVVTTDDVKKLCLAKSASRLVVQEKVDGANVSIYFISEWEPVMQKRSGVIGTSEKDQYNVFRDWCWENISTLYSLLSTQYCAFGEWLWNQHSVSYDSLPSFFLLFDIYDITNNTWLSTTRIENLIETADSQSISTVPTISSIDMKVTENVANIDKTFDSFLHRKSEFSTKEVQEGIYVRVESDDQILWRAKLRRSTFVAGRSDIHIVKNNKLLQ